MSGNINTYKIKPLNYKVKQECCGYDVDANEDGCTIIPCECKICIHNKTQQLEYLITEINTLICKSTDNDLTLKGTLGKSVELQSMHNVKEKIEMINRNQKVYTTYKEDK